MNRETIRQWYDFSGKTAVITGGAGVLGGEMAAALVGCGADVAIVIHHTELPASLKSKLEAGSGRYLVTYADVTDRDAVEAAAQEVQTIFDRIDFLVNAAGGNQPQATTGSENIFFDLPPDALDFVFNLNLMGTILPCQVFGRMMAGQGEGVILNVSSLTAFTPLTHIPAYSAAKAGVNNFTQWLAVHMAQEYAPGIRVNAIAPGFFLTHQNRFLLTSEETGSLTQRGRQIIEQTPMARFGRPEDLVGTVLWLLSPAAAFVTGTVIPVDGGFHAFTGV